MTHYMYVAQECSEKEWLSKIRSTLKMLHNVEYEKVASQTLWGIRLIILVKPEHTNKITHVQASQVRTGIGNALGKRFVIIAPSLCLHVVFVCFLGNKGGVGISLFYGSVSLCFVNCHLTSGNEKCSRYHYTYMYIGVYMCTHCTEYCGFESCPRQLIILRNGCFRLVTPKGKCSVCLSGW